MRVTVGICAFNEGKSLAKNLASVLPQLAPDDELVLVASGCTDNTVEVARSFAARDARVIAVATQGDPQIERFADDVCWVPDTHEAVSAVLAIIPLQLFAYHIAVEHGRDVDKPRNLAKSVTVE